jgi:hypothetical protein
MSDYEVSTGSASALDGTEKFAAVQGAVAAAPSGDQIKTYVLAGISETIDDRIAALLAAGSNVSLTYDDGTGTLTIASTDAHATNVTRSDKSANYTILVGDAGKAIRADATAGALTITMPAAATSDGDFFIIRKSDNSTNRVTVNDNGGTALAWLSTQYDEVNLVWWNGGWVARNWRIAPLPVVFTANGTFTKPPLSNIIEAQCIGSGGAGAGGCGGDNSAVRAGGGAGGAGGVAQMAFPASAVGATETVVVGTAPAGGAGSTAGATGSNGTIGNPTSFGTLLMARGGMRGTGGGATGGAGGTSGSSTTITVTGASSTAGAVIGAGGTGGTTTGSAGTKGATPELGGGPGGGGGGGGISTGSVESVGGAGGSGHNGGGLGLFQQVTAATGGGGTAGAVGAGASPGTAGGTPVDVAAPYFGDGGGGGGATSGATGGAGAPGAAPGGGGGGGSGARTTGGAGGAGARGEARITVRF